MDRPQGALPIESLLHANAFSDASTIASFHAEPEDVHIKAGRQSGHGAVDTVNSDKALARAVRTSLSRKINPARIHVANVSEEATYDDLENYFSLVGRIKAIVHLKRRCIIDFESSETAEDAVKQLNGTRLLGHNLKIEVMGRGLKKTQVAGKGLKRARDRYATASLVSSPYPPTNTLVEDSATDTPIADPNHSATTGARADTFGLITPDSSTRHVATRDTAPSPTSYPHHPGCACPAPLSCPIACFRDHDATVNGLFSPPRTHPDYHKNLSYMATIEHFVSYEDHRSSDDVLIDVTACRQHPYPFQSSGSTALMEGGLWMNQECRLTRWGNNLSEAGESGVFYRYRTPDPNPYDRILHRGNPVAGRESPPVALFGLSSPSFSDGPSDF